MANVTLETKIMGGASSLVYTDRKTSSKEELNAIARELIENIMGFCEEHDIDVIGERCCPVCKLLDEAWPCNQCGRAIQKSQMIHAGSCSPLAKRPHPFVAFCPHCGHDPVTPEELRQSIDRRRYRKN